MTTDKTTSDPTHVATDNIATDNIATDNIEASIADIQAAVETLHEVLADLTKDPADVKTEVLAVADRVSATVADLEDDLCEATDAKNEAETALAAQAESFERQKRAVMHRFGIDKDQWDKICL